MEELQLETRLEYPDRLATKSGEPRQDLALTVRIKLHRVLNASRLQSQTVARLTGISASQLVALNEIRRNPGIRIGEFARLHDIKSSTASNLLDKLEQRGWVRRERGDADQRIVRLFLTDAGEAIIEKYPVPKGGTLGIALNHVPVESLAALDRGLTELLIRLEETAGDVPPAPATNS